MVENTMKNQIYCQIGSAHKRCAAENQDVVLQFENGRFALLALADGASFASHGRQGAQIACQSVQQHLLRSGTALFDCSPTQAARFILQEITYHLAVESNEANQSIRAYASTLSAALLDKKTETWLLFHLGDGAVFRTDGKGLYLAMQPMSFGQNSTCLTTTHSATQYATVQYFSVAELMDFYLCSDGFYHFMQQNKQAVLDAMIQQDMPCIQRMLQQNPPEDDCSIALCRYRSAGGWPAADFSAKQSEEVRGIYDKIV